MASSGRTYDDAVDALNTLQTPYEIFVANPKPITATDEVRFALRNLGMPASAFDSLNAVHVAGTKGKGTTCAMVASILSHHRQATGYPRKIGMTISPHLISVRERIRIDSEPISKEMFARYFFELWDKLGETAVVQAQHPEQIPRDARPRLRYARFIVLMSLYVFLREGVDVAILETGMGGELDATNVLNRPAVTGITSLGIDHTDQLGTTIEEIAWHKGGIIKRDCPAFTVEQRFEAALPVLQGRAKEKDVALQVVRTDPRLQKAQDYDNDGTDAHHHHHHQSYRPVKIIPDAKFQRGNVSLAIRLAETVLQRVDPTFEVSPDVLPRAFTQGLEIDKARGRCETLDKGDGVRWYLDCAHTADSLKIAAKWFGKEIHSKEDKKK